MSFVITGRIHGVGYRAYVKWLADQREVRGEVYNTSRGNVEGIAYHPDSVHLEDFLIQLAKGPGSPHRAIWDELTNAVPSDVGFLITNTRP